MDTHRPRSRQLVGCQTNRLMLTAIICIALIDSVVRAATDGQCSESVPGVPKMFRGVDVTQLDLTPPDFTTDDGYKSPVIAFTCNEGRRMRRDSKSYQIPDQISHVTNKPGGSLTENVQLYKSSSDVRSRMSFGIQAQGWLKHFGFSASRSYTTMQRTIMESDKYISDVFNFYSSIQVGFKTEGSIQLDSVARRHLETDVGNQTYQSNPQAYQRFIDHFGTHFFSVASFGGHIRSVYEIEMEYFQSHTDEQAKNNARASFLAWLAAHGGKTDRTQTIDSRFSLLSTETVRYYGGSANLLSSEGIQTWQPTVDENPWLVSGELKAISDLIRNKNQRSSMEEAVKQHILQAYLGELRRLMTIIYSIRSAAISHSLRNIEDWLAQLEAFPLGALVERHLEDLELLINQQLDFEHARINEKVGNNSSNNSSGNDIVSQGWFIPVVVVVPVVVVLVIIGIGIGIRRHKIREKCESCFW